MFDIFNRKKLDRISKELEALINKDSEKGRMINNTNARYPSIDTYNYNNTYATIDDVYSIIKLIATTSALIPFYAFEVKNDKELKSLKNISFKSEPYIHKMYELKALQELKENDNLNTLLSTPNSNQYSYEFFESVYTLLFIHGETFIYTPKLELGRNEGQVYEMISLLPQHVVMKVSNTFPQRVICYDYVVDGIVITKDIPVEDIIHIKMFNPASTYDNQFRGLSPIKVLLKKIERMKSALDNSVKQLQNSGVPGIVFEKSDNHEVVENMGQRKNNFYKYLQAPENKGAPYFSAGDLGYISLGLSTTDLQTLETEKIDFKKLCNAFGVSDVLFNNSDASTESNVKEMTKRLYTMTILPNVQRVRDAINKQVAETFTDKKRYVNWDISEISELQSNQKELAEWLDKSWWITPNEKRALQKFDIIDDENMNQNIIPSGLQLISDLTYQGDI
jgi:HK97 family phage portal protein